LIPPQVSLLPVLKLLTIPSPTTCCRSRSLVWFLSETYRVDRAVPATPLVGLKWLWPGRIPQGQVTVEHDLKKSLDTRLVVIDTIKLFAPIPKLMRESLGMLDDLAAKYQVAILVLIQSPVKYDKEDKLKKDPRPWDEAAP